MIIHKETLFSFFDSNQGPALGALLFSLGGFQLPFLVVGSVGLVVATCLLIIIPNVKPDKEKKKEAKLINYTEIAKVFCQIKGSVQLISISVIINHSWKPELKFK